MAHPHSTLLRCCTQAVPKLLRICAVPGAASSATKSVQSTSDAMLAAKGLAYCRSTEFVIIPQDSMTYLHGEASMCTEQRCGMELHACICVRGLACDVQSASHGSLSLLSRHSPAGPAFGVQKGSPKASPGSRSDLLEVEACVDCLA